MRPTNGFNRSLARVGAVLVGAALLATMATPAAAQDEAPAPAAPAAAAAPAEQPTAPGEMQPDIKAMGVTEGFGDVSGALHG